MSIYERQWDNYVERLFPERQKKRDDLAWPGDEWGAPQHWRHAFDTLFAPAGVEAWRAAAEIGPGSGKYTAMVLDAAPAASLDAFDVSSRFLDVCRKRLAERVGDGRLRLHHLKSKRADETHAALAEQGLVRRLDAFYSMDAMVHVDLQYLMAYLLTAALTLREGGHLILTLADATSEKGFGYLLESVSLFYHRQGEPTSKFEWQCPEMVRSVLTRLGFLIDFMENWDPAAPGNGRDLAVRARLVDPARAEALRHHLIPA